MTVIGEAFVAITPETASFASNLQSKFQALNLGGVGAVAGVALAAGITAGLISIGRQFASVRQQIQKETGETGKDLAATFDTVKNVFKDVPASLGDVTTAVDELIRRGTPLGGVLDTLAKQELELAHITKTDLATNVEATTAVFNKYGVQLKDQPALLDEIFKASQKSGLAIGDIIAPLRASGSALQQFGFTAQTAVALIGSLGKSGVNVGQSLISLRTAFANITKKGLGDPVQVFKDLNAEFRRKDPNAMADALKILGGRGVELATAMQQGKFDFGAFLKVVTDGKGGIIETADATRTLGDRFTLLKNNALVALSGLGTVFSKAFANLIITAQGPVTELTNSFGHLALSIAPVAAAAGGALLIAFKAVVAVIGPFATGLDTIASVLDHVPGPVKVAAGAIALLAVALHDLIGSFVFGGLEAGIASFVADLNPVTATIVTVGLAITALGVVMDHFSGHSRAVTAEASSMKDALFATGSEAGLFATGITSAAQGLTAFLEAQIASGKNTTLAETLASTGHSVAELAPLFSGTQAAYDRFVKSVSANSDAGAKHTDSWFDKLKAIGKLFNTADSPALSSGGNDRVKFSQRVVDALNKEQAAYVESAQKQLLAVEATGQMSRAEVNHIALQTQNVDGTINWSRVLDVVAAKLDRASVAQNALATSAAAVSPTYAALVNQFATGAVTADQMVVALQHLPKAFDEAGAKAQVETLKKSIQDLGSAVDKAFPAVSDAAKGLKNDLSKVNADLITRQATFTQQWKTLSAEGAGASQQLHDATRANFLGIANDLKALAANTDLDKFTNNLKTQAADISSFFGNLGTLVREGFGSLARELLDLGVQGGSALAAGFSSNQNKAAAANSASQLLEATKESTKNITLSQLSDYYGIGKSAGDAVTRGAGAGAAGAPAAIRSQAPHVAAAAGSLNAATTGRFHPDLATPAGNAVVDAAAKVRSNADWVAAMEFLASQGKNKFKPDLAGGATDAENKARNLIAGSTTIPTALGAHATKSAAAFGKNLTVKEQTKQRIDDAAAAIAGFSGLRNSMGLLGVGAGQDFGQGIANGIINKAGTIYVAGQAAGQAAMNGVRSKIQNKSPSRVAIQYGKDFATGLALGVLSGQSQIAGAGATVGSLLNTQTRAVIQGFNDTATIGATVQQLAALLTQLSTAATSTASSVAGAGTATSSFLQSVLSQVPAAASVLSSFLSAQSSALSTLSSATADFHAQQTIMRADVEKLHDARAKTVLDFTIALGIKQQLDAAIAQKLPTAQIDVLTQSWNDAVHTFRNAAAAYTALGGVVKNQTDTLAQSNKSLKDAQTAANAASDPRAFIKNVNDQTAASKRFLADLSKLDAEGFHKLAGELASQGVDAAGKLADAFAGNKTRARQANNAISAATAFGKTYTDTVTKIFGDPSTGAAAADAASTSATAASGGIADSVGTTFDNSIKTIVDKLQRVKLSAGEVSIDTSPAERAVGQIPRALDFTPQIGAVPAQIEAAVTAAPPIPVALTGHLAPLGALPPMRVDVAPVLGPIKFPPAVLDVSAHLAPVTIPPVDVTARIVPFTIPPGTINVTARLAPISLPPLTVDVRTNLAPLSAPQAIDVTPHLLPLPPLAPLGVEVVPHLQPLPKLDPITVDVIPRVTAAANATASLPVSATTVAGTQTLELDLTIVLEDGRVVTLKKALPLPKPGDVTQKVKTEIRAS